MRKDITKKFLMRENRYLGRMISIDVISFLVKQKQKKIKKLQDENNPKIEIEYDDLSFTKMLGTKEIDVMSINNIFESGDKILHEASRDGGMVKFNMVYCDVGSFIGNESRIEFIEKPFLLGETEVTQELYEKVMGVNNSWFSKKNSYLRGRFNIGDVSQHPIETITWFDAISFCNALSSLHNLDAYYIIENIQRAERSRMLDNIGVSLGNEPIDSAIVDIDPTKNGYRLPYGVEWEYAAKAGTNNACSGTNEKEKILDYAWCLESDASGATHPVATKKPNEWGFYDMSGNVFELCNDREQYFQMTRGGSFTSNKLDDISTYSISYTTSNTYDRKIGFRIARNIF